MGRKDSRSQFTPINRMSHKPLLSEHFDILCITGPHLHKYLISHAIDLSQWAALVSSFIHCSGPSPIIMGIRFLICIIYVCVQCWLSLGSSWVVRMRRMNGWQMILYI